MSIRSIQSASCFFRLHTFSAMSMISISGTYSPTHTQLSTHQNSPAKPDSAGAAAVVEEPQYLLGGRERLLLGGDLRGDLPRNPLTDLAPDVRDILPPRRRRRLLLPRRLRRGRDQEENGRQGHHHHRASSRHLRWKLLPLPLQLGQWL